MNRSSLTPDTSLILVVDDDRTMRNLLRIALEEEGYRVIEAKNGQQCLEQYRRWKPDMILLDAIMPDMDGFACCQSLRSSEQNLDLPILMITALDDQESIDQAFAVGATDYITKPIFWSVLAQRVKHLLSTTQALKQLNGLKSSLERHQQWHQLWYQTVSQAQQPFQVKYVFKDMIHQLQGLVNADRIGIHQVDGRLWTEVIRSGYPSVKTLPVKPITLFDVYQESYQQGDVIIIDFAQDTQLSPEAIAPFHQLMIKSVALVPILSQEKVWGILWIHHCQDTYSWEAWERDYLTHLGNLLAIAYRLGC